MSRINRKRKAEAGFTGFFDLQYKINPDSKLGLRNQNYRLGN